MGETEGKNVACLWNSQQSLFSYSHKPYTPIGWLSEKIHNYSSLKCQVGNAKYLSNEMNVFSITWFFPSNTRVTGATK